MNTNEKPVALITGAARRIGAETAKTLHNAGYRIAIHYRNSHKEAEAVCQQLNTACPDSAAAFAADLTNTAEVETLAITTLKHFGRCDLLINNASSFFPTRLEEATEEHWDNLFSSNAKAPYFLCKALAEELKLRGGSIINIADIHAERPKKSYSIYCMAKAANIMLTKSLALELAPHVRVNGVAPGAVLWPESEDGKEIENPEALEVVPLKRLGGTKSIVDTILFLANKESYITGQCIAVDGGRTLNQ